VIGELEVHTRVGGKRTLVDTIENYYPVAIDTVTYHKAQTTRTSKVGTGGRKGRQISNLFAHVAVCAYCGSPVHLKDGGPNSGKYLICDKGRRGLGCVKAGFPYEILEKTFLKVIREVDLAELFTDQAEKNRLKEIQDAIDRKTAERQEIDLRLKKLVAFIEAGDIAEPPKVMLMKLQENERLVEILSKEIDDMNQVLLAQSHKIFSAAEYREQVASFSEKFEELRGEERVLMRAKVQGKIRRLIREIKLYPKGNWRPDSFYENVREQLIAAGQDLPYVNELVDHMIRPKEEQQRQYVITFHSGRHVIATIDKQSPYEPHLLYDTETRGQINFEPSIRGQDQVLEGAPRKSKRRSSTN
jgi:hypothetical protein